MERLAIHGGVPVRTEPFPRWPVWGKEEEEALLRVLRSGRWGFDGDEVSRFEAAFSRMHAATHGICITNGTAALEVALRACGVGPGDEVIVPPYTFVATATACLALGALPAFADIDPDSYTLSPAATEAQINERTRAIIAVHVAGRPADMDALPALARRHGLALIEDAAQAHLAEWRGRPVGAIGDAGTFSFQSSKNLTAGEGGMIVTNDAELAQRCRLIHDVGRVPHGGWYEHEAWGSNYRMTQWQAAILLAQMLRLEEQNARREENARYLTEGLSELGLRPLAPDVRVTRHPWHLFIFRYDDRNGRTAMSRQGFIEAMKAEGIPCSAGYVPLYATNAVRGSVEDNLRWAGRNRDDLERLLRPCPAAERACSEAVWLRQALLLGTRADMDSIVEAAAKVLRNAPSAV